jgi:hypothetical protein
MKEFGLRMAEVDSLSRVEYHVYLEGLTHDKEAEKHAARGRKSQFKPSRYVPFEETGPGGAKLHDVSSDDFFKEMGAQVDEPDPPEKEAAEARRPKVIETDTDDFFKESGARAD